VTVSKPGDGSVVRVAIVDDDELVRVGLRVILGSAPDLEVVGEAADGAEVLHLVARVRPDVLLMDIRMPAINGIDPIRRLLDVSADPPRILVVTTFEHDDVRRRGTCPACAR
jgi:DNA-binding NarL/FixJ family response regulator